MRTLSDELFEIAGRLDAIKARDDFLTIKKNLFDLEESANEARQAWSGSWLGYQACVYYRDLNPLQPVLTSAKNGGSEKWDSPRERRAIGLNMKMT